MKKLWIVTKNELVRYFVSPLAYVYLIAFLLLNGSFAVYFGHFFDRGRADLLSMFAFQPWLYLLFIPGISMRLWAEEFRSKTVVQILTMPVSVNELVWGKFLASWLFAALALILTFPFWIVVNILGEPDNAIIAVSYLGSWILAGCMLAISQTMSALTKNQVIALVLSVVVNLLFFLSGLEYVLSFFRLFAPAALVDMVASFSFITHFATISRGLVELRDIVFFTSIILLFNFTTAVIISFKTSGTSRLLKSGRRGYYILTFILLLTAFIGLNLLANNLLRKIQYDFSSEKIFALTDTTRRVLENLPQPVTAKLYYSKILERRNPEFRQTFDKVRLLLQQYADLSDGKFQYRIYYPELMNEAEDRAIAAGLQAIPLVDRSETAYFGMTVSDDTDNRQIIPFFPLERQTFLEQDITTAVYLLNHPKPTLGILSSLPMFSRFQNNTHTDGWEILNQLSRFYDLKIIGDNLPEGLDALMIIHPYGLSSELIKQIRDYSFNGGKILLFLDAAAEAPHISAPVTEDYHPSDLGGLEKDWGFVFHKDIVVADLGNSLTVDATSNYNTNPVFTQDLIQFLLKNRDFNPDRPETALLQKILVSSASLLTPAANDPYIEFIPLIKAGPLSSLMSAEVVYNRVSPEILLRDFRRDDYAKFLAARIISRNQSKPFDLIVVADSDMVNKNFWARHIAVFDNTYYIPILDNANFIFNALESLIGGDNLIGLRGKTEKLRAFEGIEELRKTGRRDYTIKEQEVLQKIEQTKRGLQEIWGKKTFEGRENFTPDELAVIANIRKDLDKLRRDLVNIKDDSTLTIRRIDLSIKFTVIYLLPLLLVSFLLLRTLLRRRPRHSAAPAPLFTPQIFYLGLTALLLLAAGILAVYANSAKTVEPLEGKPVFAELPEEINRVSRIILQNHTARLTFIKQKGLWTLQDHPGLLVYQNRIRSFLSAMLEARYYERKSAKVEHLAKFGLQSIENPDSPAVNVALQNEQGKDILRFEVGRYDIDIGRGAKGAYLKFPDKFQVWLAAAEFIDLSLNVSDWTYGTLWNLRLGRLISFNGQQNIDKNAGLMKELLNCKIIKAADNISAPEEVLTLKLDIEGNNEVELDILHSDDKYYAVYRFLKNPSTDKLRLFAENVKNLYYLISAEDFKRLKNAAAE